MPGGYSLNYTGINLLDEVLGADLEQLGELRAALRTRMQRSPLTDAPRFARNIEAAFRTMWRRWCGE
jgi:predicted O-linked N-acetylglucosamine transferase (SPINDLY family)